jgi:hypothetical protein
MIFSAEPVFAQESLASVGAYSSKGFADGVFVDAICDMYNLVQGSLGGLLMSASALCALVAAAMGNKSQFMAVIVVGVGAFALSSGVSLYFGTFNC